MRRSTVLAVLLAPLAALAQPADPWAKKKPDKDDTAPPSTGKELAPAKVTLPPSGQAATIRKFLKAGDCKGKVAEMATALTVSAAELTSEERLESNVMLQKCAYSAKAWRSVLASTLYLIEVAPERARPYDVVEALLGLDDEEHAAQALKMLLAKFPKLTADLSVGVSLIACHKNDFAKCYKASGEMIGALKKLPSASVDAIIKNSLYHGVAAASLGKWDEYDADMKLVEDRARSEGKDTTKLKALRAGIETARTTKLFIDTDNAKQLPLGTYHYMAGAKVGDAGEILTLRLVNQDAKPRSVKIAVQVPGVTEPVRVTVPLPPGTQVTKVLSPPLKMDFDVTRLRAPRQGQIALRISSDDDKTLYENSYEIEVLPRDHLPLRRSIGSDAKRTTYANALAWITPNDKDVEAFLTKAKERVDKRRFVGEQRETVPQVKALFDELRSRGVSYVMDPSVFDEVAFYQRTRLPSEVLASTNAQCLEGTLLYATLMESIGLQPILVFVPGHAFVAWKASKYDVAAGSPKVMFLETTMTGGTATFEQAMEVAARRFAEEVKEKHFDLGASTVVDVAELRKKGYTPQPY